MFAIQFISNEIFPLKRSDSTESALLFMTDWMIRQLPVVEGGKVLGFVNEKILTEHDELKVDQCMEIQTDDYLVHEHTHVFDLWKRMQQHNFQSLTVVNSDQQYLGVISAKDISMLSYAHSSLIQEGSILVIEVTAVQYSLAEISRICESNDAKIIHLMVETIKDEANNLHVSMKLNRTYLNHVLASLERFGYKIVYTNSPLDPNHSLDDRYNWLVKYLNT